MYFRIDMENFKIGNDINFTGKNFIPIKVDRKLYCGRSVNSPQKLTAMKKLGITQIIDLRNTSIIERPLERLICDFLGIKYINFRYPHRLNSLPEQDFFKQINKCIIENNGKTYIHCKYGKHRTGVAVAIYEKFHTSKSDLKILYNLLMNGFKDILNPGSKKEKYKKIYNELVKKYFTKD